MAHGDPLEHGDLISDLISIQNPSALFFLPVHRNEYIIPRVNHHVLSAGHQPLIDDLRGIIPPGVDVHAFLHHRVGARP